jgi:hypothetical protein
VLVRTLLQAVVDDDPEHRARRDMHRRDGQRERIRAARAGDDHRER